jgi:hypothetical protein
MGGILYARHFSSKALKEKSVPADLTGDTQRYMAMNFIA